MRAIRAIGGATTASVLLLAHSAAASAADPDLAPAPGVQVVHGTQFPGPDAALGYVGCDRLLDRGDEVLAPFVSRGPGAVPAGVRSLGYDLDGGTAIGSQHIVPDLAAVTVADIAVHAVSGTTGRAVLGYQEPSDAGTAFMWFGVDTAVVPAGAWTTVSAIDRAFVWTRYDLETRTPITGTQTEVPLTVAQFLEVHEPGGPGLVALMFGCDGAAFSMDAMRIGDAGSTRTYDLEGVDTSLGIDRALLRVDAEGQATMTGHLTSSSPIPHATMLLERRADDGTWSPVRAVPVDATGTATARLSPAATADYRWRFVDRPLAEGSVSPGFRVVADRPTPVPAPPEPTPTLAPVPDPEPAPAAPSGPPAASTSATPSTEASASASATSEPLPSDSDSGSASHSGSASSSPTASPLGPSAINPPAASD